MLNYQSAQTNLWFYLQFFLHWLNFVTYRPENITRRSAVCGFQRGWPSWIYEERSTENQLVRVQQFYDGCFMCAHTCCMRHHMFVPVLCANILFQGITNVVPASLFLKLPVFFSDFSDGEQQCRGLHTGGTSRTSPFSSLGRPDSSGKSWWRSYSDHAPWWSKYFSWFGPRLVSRPNHDLNRSQNARYCIKHFDQSKNKNVFSKNGVSWPSGLYFSASDLCSDGWVVRMWFWILAVTVVLMSFSKTLYHNCFSPPRKWNHKSQVMKPKWTVEINMYFIVLLAIYKHPYNSWLFQCLKIYVQNVIWSLACNSIIWMQLQTFCHICVQPWKCKKAM